MEDAGNRRVSAARVLIVGAGDLGTGVAEELLSRGFRHFVIADTAMVPRDVTFRDVCLADILVAELAGEGASASSFTEDLRRMGGWNYEVILCCDARFDDRMLANNRARQYSVCLVDGAVSGNRGRIQAVLFDGPCLQCLLTLRSARNPEPPSGMMVEAVASAMADEAEKIVKGHMYECTAGVMYIEGPSMERVVLNAGVSPACPYHKINNWQKSQTRK